jgi:hypothetical protein
VFTCDAMRVVSTGCAAAPVPFRHVRSISRGLPTLSERGGTQTGQSSEIG